MAWVAVGTTALSFANASMQADITLEQGQTQRAIDNMNADFEDLDSFHALQSGEAEAAANARDVTGTIASQRAGYASQGVDVNSGTAAEVQSESKLAGFLNGLALQNRARAQAYGIEIKANNTRLGAINAYEGAAANASSTLFNAELTGAGNIARGIENQYSPAKPNSSGYKSE